jgi:hypothetical protein
LLGVLCVVLLLAGLGAAETTKKKKANGAAARKPQAHPATAAHKPASRSNASPRNTSSRKTARGAAEPRTTTASRGRSGGRGKVRPAEAPAKVKKPRGQQSIDSDRAREIQEALIRENYLTGEPSGSWDSDTRQAMMRYQGDHGWQTKVTPDARALIKLGLGPKHAGLINPESISESIPSGARDMRPGGAAFPSN